MMGKDSNSRHQVLVVLTSHLAVGIFRKEHSQVVSKYSKIMLIPFIFIVDSTMNLMSGLHHECERRKHYSLCSKNYSFRNQDSMCMSRTTGTELSSSFSFFFLFLVSLLVTCYYLFILCLAWWCLFAQHHYCPYFSVS